MERIDEFIVDKEAVSITIRREFDAELVKVWKAWTTQELLDQWWAPDPWSSMTKHMSFKIGGSRLYAMCSPEGEKHWGLTKYHSIVPLELIIGEDFFCDEEGNMNAEMPSTNFEQTFSNSGTMTLVIIENRYESLAQLEMVVSMGFKDGMSAVMKQLDKLLNRDQ